MSTLQPIIPAELRAKEAIHALGGYVYQVLATGLAWLELGADDQLIVETAQDYAILAGDSLAAVQVRNTGGSGSVSLGREAVRAFITDIWRLGEANPQAKIKGVYLTSSRAGEERQMSLPKGECGLDLWMKVRAGQADGRQLIETLRSLPWEPVFASWIGEADDAQIEARLIEPIEWRLGAPGLTDLQEAFEDATAHRCVRVGLAAHDAQRVRAALFLRLLEVASSAGSRTLTRRDLDSLINEASQILVDVRILRRPASVGPGYIPPLDLRTRDDPSGRLFFFGAQDRTPLIGRVEEHARLGRWARERSPFSWTLLTGSGGMGKSRLALELAQELSGQGWHAGFLSSGSALVSAERFAAFRPAQPTLIIIDYVSLVAAWAGEVVRTLIDLTTTEPFAHQVRVLLIERTGPSAPWWDVFNGHQAQRLLGRASRLGDQGFLELPALRPTEVWSLFKAVAGEAPDEQRDLILDRLAQIDPRKTPLFTCLAGEAMRAGRDIWQFDRNGLLNDIFLREQQRWRQIARDEEDLDRHERSAALATMMGGISFELARRHASSPDFAFEPSRLNPRLAEAVTGPPPGPGQMIAIEPDILGEWFVLRRLTASHGYDHGPKLLRAAANGVVASDAQALWGFAGFRGRLAQDFPEAAAASGLYDPPPDDAPAPVWASLLSVLAATLRRFDGRMAGEEVEALYQAAVVGARRYAHDRAVQMSSTALKGVYGEVLVDANRDDEALKILEQLGSLAGEPDFIEPALAVSRAGLGLGGRLVARGDPARAFGIMQDLQAQAERFMATPGDDWREMQRLTAALGLAIRESYRKTRQLEAVNSLDDILWSQAENRADLAIATAECLAEVSLDHGIVPSDAALGELERRSRQRRDLPRIAVLTAEALFAAVWSEYDEQKFVDRVRRLTAWLKPRMGIPGMAAVHLEAVREEWLNEDFTPGKLCADQLLTFWKGSYAAAIDAKRDPNRDPYTLKRRAAFEEMLTAAQHMPWAEEMRRRYLDIKA